VYFTLGGSPISELIGFGDTAYRGIGTPFQSPAQNTPPAVSGNFKKTIMNKIIPFLLIAVLLSCKTKNSDKNSEKLSNENVQIEKEKENIDTYAESFNLENFIVETNVSESEITIINEDCGIILSPDSAQIDAMKGETEEEQQNFYVAADDNNFYQYETSKFLDSLNIKKIYPKTRYLKFSKNNENLLFDTKAKYSDGWMVILYLNNKKPKIVDFVSFEDSYNQYIDE
jgi:hypothetical protein